MWNRVGRGDAGTRNVVVSLALLLALSACEKPQERATQLAMPYAMLRCYDTAIKSISGNGWIISDEQRQKLEQINQSFHENFHKDFPDQAEMRSIISDGLGESSAARIDQKADEVAGESYNPLVLWVGKWRVTGNSSGIPDLCDIAKIREAANLRE